jgi:hypothetical protein
MSTVLSVTLDDRPGSELGNAECKAQTESDPPSGLFERNWDYFVIKSDDVTGKLLSFIECCGKLSGFTP